MIGKNARFTFVSRIEPYTNKHYLTLGYPIFPREKGPCTFGDVPNAFGVFASVPYYYYAKYSGDWDIIRKDWEFLKEMYEYCKRVNDWANLTISWGESDAEDQTDMGPDGFKVPICMMYMSKEVGDREVYLSATYLTSRNALSHLARYVMGDYIKKYVKGLIEPDDYILQIGLSEYGYATDPYTPWKGNLAFVINNLAGTEPFSEIMDLYQEYLTRNVKNFMFETIPAHFPDGYPPRYKSFWKNLNWIRIVLGEPAEDIIKKYKIPAGALTRFKLLPFISALSGKNAPLYLIDWQPNRLISGTYNFRKKEAIIKIDANAASVIKFKSQTMPVSIWDKNVKLSKERYNYNKKKNILILDILKKGEHIIKIRY